MNFFNKTIYLRTNTNFNQSSLKLKNPKLIKNFSNLHLNIHDNQLPVLKSYNQDNANKEKLISKIKLKKTNFLKSQEKISKLIKEEENFKQYYLNIIQKKVKDEEREFNSFLLKSNDISESEPIRNTLLNTHRVNDRYQRRIEREEKKVFPAKRNLGKSEIDSNDYLARFHLLFPDEFIDDESEIEKKTKEAIKIQKYFREHRDKKKLYCGFEEPNYLVRIYEHEYEVYPIIKSVEIKIYSTLFQKNVIMYKTIEELFGITTMAREKIQKRIGEIIGKIIGVKSRRAENSDYYDPAKADLSSDDFNDFEEDDS